jgi:glycosyltransferase A (GT-A) superfamily protein (DUF2064 family)
MDNESKNPLPTAVEHVERLKRDYIENAISLMESFARKAARYAQQGDEQAARIARSHFETFCQSAREMVQKLRDPQTAEVFLEKLRRVGCHSEDSQSVA